MTQIIISFLAGLITGIIGYYLLFLRKQNASLKEQDGIPRFMFEDLEKKLTELERELILKAEKVGKLEAENIQLKDKGETQKMEFENLANKILRRESEQFLNLNKTNLDSILNPFKENISNLQKKVETFYDNETQQRSSLKKEIELIVQANQTLSKEANELSQALKGDKKKQGNWGEIQLETLLEKTGLQKGIHFSTQVSLYNTDGANYRPDFIINLPNNKHIVLDSKVSLVHYEQYFHTENEDEKEAFLKGHLHALKKHIDELSSKNYPELKGLNSVDYTIMFIPIEPALTLAIEKKNGILQYALEKGIVLSSTITLFPILKTISFIWKQDEQTRNSKHIATKAGEMYDQFVAFIEDLNKVGDSLNAAQNNFESAKKRLSESPKRSTTLIHRAQELKELGVNTKKELLQ